MKPVRRELLNGLFVLIVASLLSVAFSAFQVSFNPQLWVLILMAIAIAVTGYILFEITLGVISSAEEREKALAESTRQREEEWLRRVGTPARLDSSTIDAVIETIKAMTPGSDLTMMFYIGPDGGAPFFTGEAATRREELYRTTLEWLKRGTIREYKRIICFDNVVLANNHDLRTGILRVGEGPGTIDRTMGNHCHTMLTTKNCSLFVAPAIYRAIVTLYGTDKISFTVESADPDAEGRQIAGTIFFSDPPNGDIVEQFRQMERATERRMVAVRKIRFPEDATPSVNLATR